MRKDETIGFQIRCTANLVSRFIDNSHKNDECGEKTITKMQGWIIDYIYDHGEESVFSGISKKSFQSEGPRQRNYSNLWKKTDLLQESLCQTI